MPATLRRFRDVLQTTPWLSLIGYGMLTMLYGAIGSLFLPRDWQRPFMHYLLAASLLMLVAKDMACLPLHIARVRVARARGATWPRSLCAAVPPGLFAYLRLERAMWRGCANWLLRRAPPPLPAGQALGYLDRGAYTTLIACLLVALLIEAPIDVMIASLMAKTPAQSHALHLAFGLLAAYSFVWVLGDRWHVLGRRCHVLTDDSLVLDLGARGHGTILLDAIAGCARLDEPVSAWCKRHGVPLHAARKLTPFDAPNLVLMLRPGSDVRLTLLQVERGGDGPIFLYLDRPELLVATSPAADAGAETPPCPR